MKEIAARDIMNRNILAVRRDWTVEQLANFLIDSSISGAPVISDDGKLVGVVSLTDIVRYNSLPIRHFQSAEPHEYYFHALEYKYSRDEIASFRIGGEWPVTVGDIMTPIIFDVNEDTKVQHVADAMIKGRIHRVFVTHNEKLVGIITALDMIKIIRDL
ncbi:MAG: CBS domain-containing protein [Thermodesulfobacteriota bacterium]|nr:CBS domain-containing protein [Thermodesulfobacteriota bacterium]